MQNPKVVITEALGRALEEAGLTGVPVPDFVVEHPRDENHGDYSTNLAMAMFRLKSIITDSHVGDTIWATLSDQYKSPRELAEKLITSLQNDAEIASLIDTKKLEVAGAGFINFTLKSEFLVEQMNEAKKAGYGKSERLKGKKVMVEYTDPNPFKEMHIGHLMSNTIGESIARLIEAQGAEVKRANYQGDVGLHVAKAVWGMREELKTQSSKFKTKTEKSKMEEMQKWDLGQRQKMLGAAYAYGATKYEESEDAKAEINALNKKIYERSDQIVNELYDAGRAWSLEYFETIYKRLGTKFDEYFFESESGGLGLSVVDEGLAKQVLEIGEDGTVVYKGEKDGLHTRVFRNKLGLPTYEAKDLGLAKAKWDRYKYDLSYIVTANEITEYFKVVLRVMEQLYPDLRAKTTHIPHGVMKLTTGKMSSRTGKVVTAEGLLNDLMAVVSTRMGEREIENKNQVADNVAVGALKYTVLRQAVGGDIVYDPDKMTNLEGATGPFVQYSYARAESIIRKVGSSAVQMVGSSAVQMVGEEMALMRWLYRYPEVIEEAGRALAPHMVAGYIYELAARFNSFYQKCRVEEDGEVNQFRYELTEAVANVLSSGLNVLGIVAPAEM